MGIANGLNVAHRDGVILVAEMELNRAFRCVVRGTTGHAAAVAKMGPMQSHLAKSNDAAEGVASFIEKRPATFTGS